MRLNPGNLTIKILLGVILGISSVLCKGTLLMLLIVAMTGMALWKFLPKCDRKFLLGLFILGMFLRILIYSSFYLISPDIAGRGEFVPDSRLYTLRAINMVRIWLGYPRLPFQIETGLGINGYVYILAFFYLLIGYIPHFSTVNIEKIITYSLFSDKLINCLIGTLTGIVIFYIAKEIFNKKVAKLVSVLVVFFPSLFLWSMTNTRDPSNILLVSLIILSLINLIKRKKVYYFILLFAGLLFLKTIRPYIFYFTLVTVGISLLTIFWRNIKIKFFVLFLVVSLSLIFLNLTSQGRITRDKLFNFSAIVKTVYSANKNVIAQRGSVYKIYDDDLLGDGGINKFKFAKGVIKGFVYFMLVPFPWMTSSREQLMAYPQIIIWYLILPFVFMGIFFALRHRFKMSSILLSYLFLVTSGFALVEGNVGSAMRHRDLLLPFYFIFGIVGALHLFSYPVLNNEEK